MILDVVNSLVSAISIGLILFFFIQNNYEQFENLWGLMHDDCFVEGISYICLLNCLVLCPTICNHSIKAIISFQNILEIKNVTGKSRFQFLILFAVFVSVK